METRHSHSGCVCSCCVCAGCWTDVAEYYSTVCSTHIQQQQYSSSTAVVEIITYIKEGTRLLHQTQQYSKYVQRTKKPLSLSKQKERIHPGGVSSPAYSIPDILHERREGVRVEPEQNHAHRVTLGQDQIKIEALCKK